MKKVDKFTNTDYLEAFKYSQNGNLELIISFYQRRLVSHFSRRGATKVEAEDIFYKAIAAIFERITKEEDFKFQKSFEAYLYQICRYIWKDIYSRKGYKNEIAIQDKEDFEADNDLIDAIVLAEKNQYIFDKIISMKENCRNILTYFYWKKMSLAEIGEKINLTKNAVKQQKFRCLKQFKELLEKDSHSNDFL